MKKGEKDKGCEVDGVWVWVCLEYEVADRVRVGSNGNI